MEGASGETQELLSRAREGDRGAFEELFGRHRNRLRRAIALRMDPALAARADASDVLQETYLEAFRRLPAYLQEPKMPFFLWLRWIAREKVLMFRRRHLGAGRRTVRREVPLMPLESSARFVSGIMGKGATPSQELAKAELAEFLQRALARLGADERELILRRHFDQLSIKETAELFGITEAAASKRYLRALERLRGELLELGVGRSRS